MDNTQGAAVGCASTSESKRDALSRWVPFPKP